MAVNPLNEIPDLTPPPPPRTPRLLIGGAVLAALVMVAMVVTPPPSASDAAAAIADTGAATPLADSPLALAGGDPETAGAIIVTAEGSPIVSEIPSPDAAALLPSEGELAAVAPAPSTTLEAPFYQVETPAPTPPPSLDPATYVAPAFPIGGIAAGDGTERGGGYTGFCATDEAFPVSAAMSEPLDAAFARVDREIDAPALAAAVRFADGSIWARGTGSISIEGSLPATSSSSFSFASVSKTTIATVILLLAERGKLRLTDRVVDLLPGTAIDPRATVAQLLSHRSGLGDYLDAWPTEAAMARDPSAVLRPADYLFAGGPYRAPGDFYYSNSGYVLLSQIIELHYPRWIDAVRSELLDPAGACSIYAPGLDGTRPGLARGYYPSGGGWRPTGGRDAFGPAMSTLSVSGSAGGLVGSMPDLARLGAAIYGSGLLRDSTREVALPRWAGSYSLLGFRYSVDGRAVFGHSGRLGGARSQLFYDRASGISVAVAYSVADPDPGRAAAIILRAALDALAIEQR